MAYYYVLTKYPHLLQVTQHSALSTEILHDGHSNPSCKKTLGKWKAFMSEVSVWDSEGQANGRPSFWILRMEQLILSVVTVMCWIFFFCFYVLPVSERVSRF